MAGFSQCVVDSSVLIDLYRCDLIETLFKLPLELITPDVIVEELENPDGRSIIPLGLRVREMSGSQVLKVTELAARYLQPSRQDLFALVLAQSVDGVLLTGDRKLREAAEAEGIKVHGTIWILDQMVDRGVIDAKKRAKALKMMLAAGSRLPPDEVKARSLE